MTVTAGDFREHMLARGGFEPDVGGLVRYRTEADTLDGLFELRCAERPDAALYADADVGAWHTRAACATRVERIASGLVARGLEPGDRVAMVAANRVDVVLTMLATVRAGGIAVPVNHRLAAPEIAQIIEDADPKVVVTEAAYADGVDASRMLVGFGEGATDPGELTELEAEPALQPSRHGRNDPVFLIYTSGTTGVPKGAVLTHDNVLQNIQGFWRALGTTGEEVALVASPLFHVTGLMAQVGHMLQASGRCVLQQRFSPSGFLDAAEHFQATYTCAVPSIFRMLLNQTGVERRRMDHFRTALFGGSAMPPDTLRELDRVWPQLRLVNTYGATESSGSCTFLPAEMALSHPLSVGYVVPHAAVRIVDADGHEVDDGVDGEVVISGPTLTQGYWRMSDAPDFRWGGWASGDIAVRHPDGLLELLDRKKDLINRGGEKIFSIELENVLHGHPDVREAGVTAIDDDVLLEEVLAVVVPRAGARLDEDMIRSHVAAHLASYKVPRYVIVTDELPKGGTGKVDKHALAVLFRRHARRSS